jgi:hypothetical protein
VSALAAVVPVANWHCRRAACLVLAALAEQSFFPAATLQPAVVCCFLQVLRSMAQQVICVSPVALVLAVEDQC